MAGRRPGRRFAIPGRSGSRSGFFGFSYGSPRSSTGSEPGAIGPCFFLMFIMLNKALRHLRRYHRIKQQDLAQQLGISASYLSEIESGAKAHAITVDLLSRYAEVFKVPISSLMLFSEELESGKRSEKIRVAMAAKLLKVLDWIDQHADDRETA